MTIDVARFKARQAPTSGGCPAGSCWTGLRVRWSSSADRTRSTWRTSRIGSIPWKSTTPRPHAEYLESEPDRFYPLEVHHPEGETESKIG